MEQVIAKKSKFWLSRMHQIERLQIFVPKENRSFW